MDSFWVGVFSNASTLWGILALAAFGGLLSERSGIINIALEGKMLTAACVTAVVATFTQNAVLGMLAGVLSAVIISLIHYALAEIYRIDHIISGTALNILALGITNYLAVKFRSEMGSGSPMLPISLLCSLGVAIAISLFVFIRRTRGGLRLFAIGDDPEKSRTVGVVPKWIRLKSLAVAGVLCGLSGVLVVSNTGTFTDNMTAGRGFIALAALIVGGWRPLTTAAACVLFATLEALQIQLQGTSFGGITIPVGLWSMTPYLVTLLALAGLLGRVKAPSGLGRP